MTLHSVTELAGDGRLQRVGHVPSCVDLEMYKGCPLLILPTVALELISE